MVLKAVLGKNGIPFSKPFPKIVDFQSKLGQSNHPIRSSFGLSFVPLNNRPYLEFRPDIIALSGIFVKN